MQRLVRLIVLAATLVTFHAGTARAQSILDPQRVEFTPSADHDTVTAGIPVVTGYSLSLFASGSATPAATVSLGKPTPDPDGQIRVPFLSLLTAPLSPTIVYTAKIVTEGPGGSATSEVSNTFTFSAPCSATVSPGAAGVGAAGGSASIAVTASGSTCGWSAATSATWLTISSGSSGTGNGAVVVVATRNPSATPRTATVLVAGSTITITQAAAARPSTPLHLRIVS